LKKANPKKQHTFYFKEAVISSIRRSGNNLNTATLRGLQNV